MTAMMVTSSSCATSIVRLIMVERNIPNAVGELFNCVTNRQERFRVYHQVLSALKHLKCDEETQLQFELYVEGCARDLGLPVITTQCHWVTQESLLGGVV